jgi:hypothetical protein
MAKIRKWLGLGKKSEPHREDRRGTPKGTSLKPMGVRRTDSVRIATGQGIVEIPWESSQQFRGRLLAGGLDLLEDEFAAKGTSAPIVVEATDKEPLLAVVLAWIEDVGEEQAVALGGLLALRDALGADLAAPPDPPVGGGEHA